jgi:wobble nucleotide-excising tRNase
VRVTRLPRVANEKVFRGFVWPASLLQFSQFNVIYGWNGSGKTTLSGLFGRLQHRDPCGDDVHFEVDGVLVPGGELAEATLPEVRVFNRDFVAATLTSSGDELNPILYVGEASVELQGQVEALRKQQEKAAETSLARAREREASGKAVEGFLTQQAKLIKEALRTSQPTGFQNYDKRSLRSSLEAIQPGEVGSAVLSDADEKEQRARKDAEPRGEISALPIGAPVLTRLVGTARTLAERSILSKTLDALSEDAAVARWVQQGLNLHSGEHEVAQCRFCLNPLTDERRADLDAHFSEQLRETQRELQGVSTTIGDVRRNLESGVRASQESERFYPHLRRRCEEATQEIVGAADAVEEVLAQVEAIVAEKERTILVPVKVPPELPAAAATAEKAYQEALASFNSVVGRHNQTTSDFATSVREACERLERSFVAGVHQEFLSLVAAYTRADEAHKLGRGEPVRIAREVEVLEGRLVEHRTPADELNAELRAYLGHDELRLEVRETGYSITRAGHPATGLSEGERTAIAFLYFLKTLQDRSFNLEEGVVVIDDPVSSLDASALFSAFGYMKARTKTAGQLFILTHNFSFFRQVRNWFHRLPGQNKKNHDLHPARFYLLATGQDQDGRTSALAPLDPLLREYASEYHYLFKRVYEEAHRPAAEVQLGALYALPNMARRLLESFLAFRFPALEGDLFRQMQELSADPATSTRILRFLHTYSHSPSVDGTEHDPSQLAEASAVLKALLELMESTDKGHFEGMRSLVDEAE